MSENGQEEAPPEPERLREPTAASLRLRSERPRVTRLSRKALAGGAAVALIAVSVAVFRALQNNRTKTAPEELYSTDHRTTAEGLTGLPRDYAGIPRAAPQLGPPLPGDLGRPMLNAGGAPNTVVPTTPAVDPEVQRRAQEIEAARLSRLFASTNIRELPVSTPAPAVSPDANGTPGQASQPSTDAAFAHNGQDRKLAFVNGSVDRRTTSPDRLAAPASAFVVQAGTVIPGALITGIRSDLPGQITAQVTENVYDSPTGKSLLIPQGARLIGNYDSQVSFGQPRVLLVWTRLILPSGKSIVLERQPGADAAGYSGLEDEVDNHWGMLFKAAMLSTLLSVGSEAGTGSNENSLVQALRQGASQSFNQTGQQVVGRYLNIQPTLTIRPGFPVCDRQPRSRARTLSRLRRRPMAKLKLGAIADERPIKLTVELPAAVHRDLIAYAEALGRETGHPTIEPTKLIAPMLARFIAGDRAFAKLKNVRKPALSPAHAAGATPSIEPG